MNIIAFFTSSGVPATGLSPTIRVRNVETGGLVVTDQAMTETGDGFYKYDYTGYDPTLDYAIRCDGTATLPDSERYVYAGNESYYDDIQQSTWTASVSAYEGKNVMGAMTTMLYGDNIHVDTSNGVPGTSFPAGTHRFPSSNVTDAISIAMLRGLHSFRLHSSITVEATHNINGFAIQTVGRMGTTVTLTAGCSANNAVFRNVELTGELTNGDVVLVEDCQIGNFEGFTGIMNVVIFSQGAEISIGNWANIIEGNAGGEPTNEPEISINSSMLTIAKYTGNLKLKNKDAALRTTVELDGGNIIFDTTCVSGTIQLLGHGFIEADNSGPNCNIDTEGFLSSAILEEQHTEILTLTEGISADIAVLPEGTADAVWDETLADHTTAGTYGHELATKADLFASAETTYTLPVTGYIIDGDNDSGVWTDVFGRDSVYWVTGEDGTDGIRVEFRFNLPSTDHKAGVFRTFGRYIGTPAGTHFITLWIWNYETDAFEGLITEFMPGGSTSDAEYTHEYFERNIDRSNNNEIRIRLKHNVTSYNQNHQLYLDFVEITSILPITAEDIADAVWSKTLSGGYTAEDIILQNNEYLKRIVGLVHENIFIDQPVYDVHNNLVSARVRIYSDSVSVGTGSNIIGTYTITSPGDGPGKFTSWKQVKV